MESSTTQGSGAYDLDGAVLGYQDFSGVGNGNTCYYSASDGRSWEVGLGTYVSASSRLIRTSVLAGSNGTSPVNWLAGTKYVWVDYPASAISAGVTGVTVATANGFAGATSGGPTPELTLSTTVNASVLKGDGTAISAATTTGSGSTVVLSDSPALTGVPTVPTAAVDTNTTQAASTEMVLGQAASVAPLANAATAAVGTSTRYARADHVHFGREVLTGARTYYVATTGSDSNNGLTVGTPFLTLQKAVSVTYGLDLNGYDVTIQVADGTYTSGVALSGPFVGKGNVTIVGNVTTPANALVNVTSANAFQAVNNAIITVKGFKVTTTIAGSVFYASYGGIFFFDKMDFGTCAGAHITASDFGEVAATLSSSYTISGSATIHAHAFFSAVITLAYNTITVSGTPAFSSYFAGTAFGYISFEGTTFSGSATGTRYLSHKNGVIDTNGGGATFLPGNVAGSTATGGQYI